jgi:hypothetical protein
MNESFDKLFGPDSEPIRRDAVFTAIRDAQGNVIFRAITGESFTLSKEGSPDRASVITFFHCGHPASEGIGILCGETGCTNVSCKACSIQSRCQFCFIGLCLEHLRRATIDEKVVHLCGTCQAKMIRQRRWRALMRAIISPFVETSDR